MQTLIHYCYQHATAKSIVPDPQQLAMIHALQSIGDALLLEHKKRKGLFGSLRRQQKVKGFYSWGPVGVGKTFVMDCFYSWLPLQKKMRMHFHVFMRYVHQLLKKHQGQKDPIKMIAKEFHEKAIILCFDELFVTEIVDAVILAGLFDALINIGVTLMFTSNVPPDDLYKRGLLRERFLPAIALIKANTIVKALDTHTDYRLIHLQQAGVFFLSTDPTTAQKMKKLFSDLTQDKKISYQPLLINDREIPTIVHTDQVAWFEFKALCGIPRSDKDYLALAERFNTLFIEHIPVIKPQEVNTIILFIRLVDILYDMHKRLVISAAASVNQLYLEGTYQALYQRTCSRLIEMQSANYYLNTDPT